MLNEKLVLVTGASRGIGRAIALTLGNAGATVIGPRLVMRELQILLKYLLKTISLV